MFLGLDLATSLGWCQGAGHEVPAFGSVRIPGEDNIGAFADFYARWLSAKLDQLVSAYEALPAKLRPNMGPMVIFEAPTLPGAKFNRDTQRYEKAPTNIATTRKLQGLAWETEKQCYQRKIECREEFLQSVKKGLAGHGKADKIDMMRAAKRAGLDVTNSDEADAFGVWLVGGIRNYHKRHTQFWDQRIYGPAPK